MISLLEVKCPHCGARGQIMLPPLGSIIVGPCPKCHELVVIFCGRVLPLSKEVMLHGTLEQQRDHLLEVLTRFLGERVTQLISEAQLEAEAGVPDRAPDEELAEEALQDAGPGEGITQDEIDHFVNIDLRRLDNADYFKKIFE